MRTSRSEFSPRELELAETCVHEAGHAIASTLYGGHVRSASVAGGLKAGAIRGLTTIDPMPEGRDAEIAYAGVWAQARWRHDRRPTQAEVHLVLDGSGRGDRAVLCAAGGMSRGAAVTPLLERCWDAVCTVAAKIATDNAVRHSDVCAALRIPVNDNGHELALIRGGCAPGSFTVTRPSVSA